MARPKKVMGRGRGRGNINDIPQGPRNRRWDNVIGIPPEPYNERERGNVVCIPQGPYGGRGRGGITRPHDVIARVGNTNLAPTINNGEETKFSTDSNSSPASVNSNAYNINAASEARQKRSQNLELCYEPRRNEQISLSNEKLQERRMPRRPGVGKQGRSIQVKINYFPLTIPSGNVYHYHVEVYNERDLQRKSNQKGRGPNIPTCRKVMEALSKAYKEISDYYPAFDGKNTLITRRQLPLSERQDFKVTLTDESGKTDNYIVKIKAVKSENEEHVINLDNLHKYIAGENVKIPLRAIQALDIIMRHIPSLRFTPVGKSLFHHPTENELHPLGGGREVWFGYYQSVRPTSWKMMVNIDKASTVFYESQPVLALVEKILNRNYKEISRFSADDIDVLTKEMRGLKIKVIHQTYARKYKIFQVTSQPVSELTFPFTENKVTRNVKVTEYFSQHYDYHLKFAHLSGLNVGTIDSPKYLPMEVCEIVEGQHCKKKLSDKQTAEMIKFTVIRPEDRFREIENTAKQTVNYNAAYMKEFGLQMNTKCIEATARTLEPPFVLYDNNKLIKPLNGIWDMRQKEFVKGAEINSWVLISMSNPSFCEQRHLVRFSNMLKETAISLGISIKTVAGIRVLQRRENIIKVLKELTNSNMVDLVVIVLSDKTASSTYSQIKQLAETQIGLKTQCIKDSNVVKKCTPALVSNLCQKINAKMGGINCALGLQERPEILKKPVIFMGADVTHPSPGDKTSVSIAAVVGSLDRHPSRYAALTRIQQSSDDKTARRIEIIQDLKEMVKELLRQFRQSTNHKPEKIIFYRDGVSEGEFQKVQDEEITEIRAACTELENGYQPGITFIVVGKRHHMRMIPRNIKDGVGSAKNVPPGTIVDTAVVHPVDFDFFLCSHFGIQGTSRPAHYTVLCDDNEFSADELQKLSFYLCHIYARCTRSISIPSPVQYAHLAAARAKHHLISRIESSTTKSSSSGEQRLLTNSMMASIHVVGNFVTSMYFV